MDEFQERRGPGRPPNPRPPEPSQTEPVRTRPARKPFGVARQRLAYTHRSNFHPHWFKDIPGRVQQALEAGYEHVKDREGKNMVAVTGTADGGGPEHCYLMEIPEEWYQEDMAAQQKEINAKEAAIKRGEADRKEGDGRYVPAQGISIKHGS